MTREEAINKWIIPAIKNTWNEKKCEEIIKALEQQPCDDAISRESTLKAMIEQLGIRNEDYLLPAEATLYKVVKNMPPVTPKPEIGHCKDCKHFEYDSVAKINGIPLIVAHEICSRWGDGCKSKEDGYCFLFEPKTQEAE